MPRLGSRAGLVALLSIVATPGFAGGPSRQPHPQPSEEVPGERRADPTAAVPDDATLEANGARIGSIAVRAVEIFDTDQPDENRALFRAANRLHVRTRERVIRDQLTFHEGEPFNRRKLDESERILRRNGYLYDAEIRPVRYSEGTVDVEVSTRDVWTLKGGFGFGRSGGVNKTRFGLHDSNFLGTGRGIEVLRSSGVDRTETTWSYRDATLNHSRLVLDLGYSSNSDGNIETVSLEKPFYGLEGRSSFGASASRGTRVDSLYASGSAFTRFGHDTSRLEAFGGWSRTIDDHRARRFSSGFTFAEDTFSGLDASAPGEVPPDRRLAYPWFGYASIHDGYVTVHDLDKIGRTEDVNLGREFSARFGLATPAFGADRTAGIVDTSWHLGASPGDAQMLLVSLDAGGRIESGGLRNAVATFALRYYRRSVERRVFYAGFRAQASSNLDPDLQVLLGGDNGLRGYPLRYALGSANWLATLEERFYWNRELFKLVRVGAAVFLDIGRTYGLSDRRGADLDVLRDVGVGLRLGQSRSAHASMIHVDLAFPLDGGSGIQRTQILVTTGETF